MSGGKQIKWAGGERPVAKDATVIVFTKSDSFAATAGDMYWDWRFGGSQGDILAYQVITPGTVEKDVPVVSDGGSSDYYKLTIKNKAGEQIDCEMGDVIRAVVANDFDLGNILKATRRMSLAKQGKGKAGTTVTYDANKIKYFADEFAFWHEVF